MNLYLQRKRGCGRTHSLRSAWVKLICVVFLGFTGLMISQLLDDETQSRAEEKKPIIIDIRSGKPSGSVDEDLYVVDGVLRYFDPNFQKVASDNKHSIQPLLRKKTFQSHVLSSSGRNQDDSLLVELLTSMTGKEEHDGFGISVAGVDDFNGDGYNDIVIGAPLNWGDVYLYFGGPEMDSVPDFEIHGDYSLGWPVASAGDINRDGVGDIIIGAPSQGINQTGKAFIFFGGSIIGNFILLNGFHEDQGFGAAVASLGDVNKDGYDDVIVGTSDYQRIGKAYVYFGGSPFDTLADLELQGGKPGDTFGYAVASAGDLNGDGALDIIVGNGWIRVDRAWIYFGGNLLDSIPDLILSGPRDSDFGWWVASAGDVNNDGFDDVMVSAHWFTETPGITDPGYGRLYIYYGGAMMDSVPGLVISGTIPLTCFGASSSSLGDINFNEYDDIIVSAHCDTKSVGKARVYLGGELKDTSETLANAVIEGEEVGDWFSHSLDGNYDVNGDGLNDILIGAHHHTNLLWQDGKVYLYTISPDRKADVNADHKINVLDVILIVRIILGSSPFPTEYELWAANVNNDNEINVEDVMETVNKILGFIDG